ncbi:SGNH/GDSL hydrolase family protein [Tumebacillus lipolyticus]|uniref:SGNH/GDSL hydrolase family protein n=1 Tax=Tumebacillus lipolyticus TaxID=1280370 RepID=A0ABW4ZVM6_9BACL
MVYYTALGDSITAGRSATSPRYAYPSLIVQSLQQQRRGAQGCVFAHDGWTSGALAGALPFGLEAIRRATTVSIWVGGNDLLRAAISLAVGSAHFQSVLVNRLARYASNLEQIVNAVRANSSACIVLCTQYNPFPRSPVAVAAIQQLNGATIQRSKALSTELAPAHEWFEGNQPALIQGYHTGRVEDALASFRRPIHPNNAGHAVIARNLSAYIR